MEHVIKTDYALNQDGGRTLFVYKENVLFGHVLSPRRVGERCSQRIQAHEIFCIPARSPDLNPIENMFQI